MWTAFHSKILDLERIKDVLKERLGRRKERSKEERKEGMAEESVLHGGTEKNQEETRSW